MVSKAEELKHVAAMKKAGVPQKYVKEEAAEAAAMKKGGSTNKYMKFSDTGTPMGMAPVKMARGGGIEQRGKTRGKIV